MNGMYLRITADINASDIEGTVPNDASLALYRMMLNLFKSFIVGQNLITMMVQKKQFYNIGVNKEVGIVLNIM